MTQLSGSSGRDRIAMCRLAADRLFWKVAFLGHSLSACSDSPRVLHVPKTSPPDGAMSATSSCRRLAECGLPGSQRGRREDGITVEQE